jgi:peptide/nickel transport system permease protein
MVVGVVGGAVAGALGVVAGLLAGYFRGRVDRVIMRAAEISMSLPVVLIALVMALVLGAGLASVLVIVALIYWARFARQVRGEVLSVKEREYVTSARAMGASVPRIIARHIVPGVIDSTIVLFTLVVGQVVVLEATLSFLGAGIPPPAPSWGNMIAGGMNLLFAGWWISVFPGLAMLLLVLAINLLGDWIRDQLDPLLSQR